MIRIVTFDVLVYMSNIVRYSLANIVSMSGVQKPRLSNFLASKYLSTYIAPPGPFGLSFSEAKCWDVAYSTSIISAKSGGEIIIWAPT